MIIMCSIFCVGLILLSIYLLIYYSHPDDSGSASGWVCKVVVVS